MDRWKLGSGKGTTALSLVEVLIVVAIIAVLASIIIPQFVGVGAATERALAQRNLNMLNSAANAFSQSDRLLGGLVGAGQPNKEEAVLAYLYAYNPAAPIPGSPFLDPVHTFTVITATNKFRASWNGRVFELINRGTAGTGVDLE